jgi:hypothetical protein
MAYTADKPQNARPTSELRQMIPHWGVDLDPHVRPAVPKEHFNPGGTGAHWDFPERQPERYPRERSPEHKFLTPVFGTAQPPKGISGMIRRYAYTLSEGRLSHWLLLVAADRVDVLESRVQALLSGQPDNPIGEAGLKAEITRDGYGSRVGHQRGDLRHQPVDLLMFALPWLALAGATYTAGHLVTRRRAMRPSRY